MSPKPDLPTAPRLATPDYSTLEVDHPRYVESELNNPPEAAQDPRSEKIYAGDNVYPVAYEVGSSTPINSTPTILGWRRKTFFVAIVAVILIVVAAVGGGIGGGIVAHNRSQNSTATPTSVTAPPVPSTTKPVYQNTGLAAIQWKDLQGQTHYRVYYQDNANAIQESAWDSQGNTWDVSRVSDAAQNVKAGTPIAAAAGYPHSNTTYTLVKNVYYMADNAQLFERQAKSNDSHAWENDNFSGLYSGTNSTFLAAYWNQNLDSESEELVVLFQDPKSPNGLTMGKYTSNSTSSYPWVANNFAFATPPGSTFALSPVASGQDLILYTTDSNGKLVQHEYVLNDSLNTDLIVTTDTPTNLNVLPNSPITITQQDNTPLFDTDHLPECSKSRPLTHVIVYTVADRSSLRMNTWNCTVGFVDTTAQIQAYMKTNATYLALASHGDARVYVMFDLGNGPLIEEWTVPRYSGDKWGPVRNVSANFGG